MVTANTLTEGAAKALGLMALLLGAEASSVDGADAVGGGCRIAPGLPLEVLLNNGVSGKSIVQNVDAVFVDPQPALMVDLNAFLHVSRKTWASGRNRTRNDRQMRPWLPSSHFILAGVRQQVVGYVCSPHYRAGICQ